MSEVHKSLLLDGVIDSVITGAVAISLGVANPETNVSAIPRTIGLGTDGTFWYKATGLSSTGWQQLLSQADYIDATTWNFVVDDDTFASVGNATVPTASSVKAYVDSAVGAGHPDYTETDVVTTGVEVIDTLTITNGHVDGHSLRNLGAASLKGTVGTGANATLTNATPVANQILFWDASGNITSSTGYTLGNNILSAAEVTGLVTDVDASSLHHHNSLYDATNSTTVAAAGAVMESDTTTASMSFVIDEDTLASDSATKVPTQQSVKAYVDAAILSSSLPDGDKGDITVSGSGLTWTIDADAVTLSKIQNITTDRILGRVSATTGIIEELTPAQVLSMIGAQAAGSYLTEEVNDLTSAVVWANVPIANIPTGTTSSTVALGDHTHSYVSSVSGGTGITSSGGLTPSLSLDFSELTNMVVDISGATEFILQSGTTESRKRADTIGLSYFEQDINFIKYEFKSIPSIDVDPATGDSKYYEIGGYSFSSMHGEFIIDLTLEGSGGGSSSRYNLPVAYAMDYLADYGVSYTNNSWHVISPSYQSPRHYLTNADDWELQAKPNNNLIDFRLVIRTPSGVTSSTLTARIRMAHSTNFTNCTYTEATGTGTDATVYQVIPFIATGLQGNAIYGVATEFKENITIGALKTIDGRDVSVDGTKLDTIATNANAYVHPDYTETDIDTTGVEVIDTMTIVNGHVNGHSLRSLGAAALKATVGTGANVTLTNSTPATNEILFWDASGNITSSASYTTGNNILTTSELTGLVTSVDASSLHHHDSLYNNYTHPTYAFSKTALAGATVVSNLTTTNGHVTDWTTRELTPADVGAAATVHTHDDRYFTETELTNDTTDLHLSSLGIKQATDSPLGGIKITQTANDETWSIWQETPTDRLSFTYDVTETGGTAQNAFFDSDGSIHALASATGDNVNGAFGWGFENGLGRGADFYLNSNYAANEVYFDKFNIPSRIVSTVTNNISAPTSVKSPIYYDSSGTTYFLDLANATTSLNVAGNITLASGATVDGKDVSTLTSNVGDITRVSGGNGLTGDATSGDATVTMGTPGSLTGSTTNAVTTTSHTHAISLTAADVGAAATSHTHPLSAITDRATIKDDLNTVTTNLGAPSVQEQALFHGQFNNKMRFRSPDSQEESTNGTTWVASSRATSSQLGDMMRGEGEGTTFSILPAGGTHYYRLTWDAWNYQFLNDLYVYCSTNGNTTTFTIEKNDYDAGWVTVATGTTSNYPGHVHIPHTTIAYRNSYAVDKASQVRVTISATTGANDVDLYAIEWFGGYPAGKRNAESYDRDRNVTFPASITASTSVASPIYYDGTGTSYYLDLGGTTISLYTAGDIKISNGASFTNTLGYSTIHINGLDSNNDHTGGIKLTRYDAPYNATWSLWHDNDNTFKFGYNGGSSSLAPTSTPLTVSGGGNVTVAGTLDAVGALSTDGNLSFNTLGTGLSFSGGALNETTLDISEAGGRSLLTLASLDPVDFEVQGTLTGTNLILNTHKAYFGGTTEGLIAWDSDGPAYDFTFTYNSVKTSINVSSVVADTSLLVGGAGANASLCIKQSADTHLGGIKITQSATDETWSLWQTNLNELHWGYSSTESGAVTNVAMEFIRNDKIRFFGTSTGMEWTLGSVGTFTGSVTNTPKISLNTTFGATSFYGALVGNASSATVLNTARNINGVSFNGSADIQVEPYIENDETTGGPRYLVFTDTTTAGYKRLNEDSTLQYNSNTNTLSTTALTLTGNATVASGADDAYIYFGNSTNNQLFWDGGLNEVFYFKFNGGGGIEAAPVSAGSFTATSTTTALTVSGDIIGNDGDIKLGGSSNSDGGFLVEGMGTYHPRVLLGGPQTGPSVMGIHMWNGYGYESWVGGSSGDTTLTISDIVVQNIEVTYGATGVEFDDGNSSTTDNINWKNSNFHKSTLTGNCTYTFGAPDGPCTLVLRIVQDAGGTNTITWPAAVKWPSGVAPTITSTGLAVDIVTFYFDGTNYYGGIAQDLK